MKCAFIHLTLWLAVSSCAQAQNVEWTNGRWFDGETFTARTFYSVDGQLANKRPARVDRRMDLAGQFVVPAFGDAHHHGIDSAAGLDSKIDRFLDEGIFYVKNPNVIPELLTPDARGKLNTADSVDVSLANGGLTATGGHPVKLHASLAAKGVFGELGPDDMENRAYFIVDDMHDLAEKWPRIRAGHPDFIKTFLLFSDRTASRGLRPDVLAAIVVKAHEAGLRVTTHVETAIDFRNAVIAGVDEITHLPMPDREISPDLQQYVIDEPSAQLAARRGVTVVTTANLYERPTLGLAGNDPDAAYLERIHANQRENLQRLVDAGVRIAIGSDGISGEEPMVTALNEVLYLQRYGLLDNLALLKAWTQNTAQTIFPERRIGRLRDGYEANFLVLAENPLVDIANVRSIRLRVKQGRVIGDVPPP